MRCECQCVYSTVSNERSSLIQVLEGKPERVRRTKRIWGCVVSVSPPVSAAFASLRVYGRPSHEESSMMTDDGEEMSVR